jgi:tRNA (adenine57-N1/adenine58-N1)-methyltransferase
LFSTASVSRKATGRFVHLLAPTLELWTLVLSHRTRILHIAGISLVVAYLELIPRCVVLESGMGSGSLTTSISMARGPPRQQPRPVGHRYMATGWDAGAR